MILIIITIMVIFITYYILYFFFVTFTPIGDQQTRELNLTFHDVQCVNKGTLLVLHFKFCFVIIKQNLNMQITYIN